MDSSINLADVLARIDERWSPHVVATLNDNKVQVVKLQGEFVWHSHSATDELFFVLHGQLVIRLRDRDVEVREGELFVVPCGVEHRPIAIDEVHVLLIEPQDTVNTGD